MIQNSDLHTPATPQRLITYVQQRVITPEQFEQALDITGYRPSRRQWQSFLDVLLLALGVGLVASGILFFLAFNWQDLHRFVKLGIVEVSIIIAVGLAIWQGLERVQGKILLTAAALLVGGLVAVYGQIYQTGADAYQLFLSWTLLITGFVLVGKFAPLWLLWLGLANLTIALRGAVIDESGGRTLFYLFLVNAVAVIAWEIMYRRTIDWADNRGMARINAVIMLFPLVANNLILVFEFNRTTSDPLLLFLLPVSLLVAFSMIYWYSRRFFDGFMLIITAVAICLCFNTWLMNTLDLGDFTPFALGFLVIGQTAGVVTWIRRCASAWEVSRSWQTN